MPTLMTTLEFLAGSGAGGAVRAFWSWYELERAPASEVE